MLVSSTLCREQEAIQRHRAATSSLHHVRLVAQRAALAWSAEARAADDREARHRRMLAIRSQNAASAGVPPGQDDRLFSENPDRGFAFPAG